jgi:hypothetical protein
MLIVWGTKRVERELGTVADFCPICREPRAFRLVRVGMAGHVYYVSFGQGKLAGHLARCLTCGVRIGVDARRFQGSGVDAATDVETMVRETQPGLFENYKERLELEATVKRAPYTLTAEQREALVFEPFALLNPTVELRYKSSFVFDRQSGIGCLGTIVVSAAVFFAAVALTKQGSQTAGLAALIVPAVGTVYTLVQFTLGPGRFVRSTVVPALVLALAPLKPLQEEVSHALDLCRKKGMKIGKSVKSDLLWAKLLERRAS